MLKLPAVGRKEKICIFFETLVLPLYQRLVAYTMSTK